MGAFLVALATKLLPVIITAALGYGAVRAIGGKNAVKSVINSATGADLTGAQTAQNEFAAQQAEVSRDFNAAEAEKARDFNAVEAEKARSFQMEMDSTKYQRTISDMRAAGVNPMLMMGGQSVSGSSGTMAASGPAASSSAASGGLAGASSMSEVLALLSLPKQLQLLGAQVQETKARTAKDAAEASRIAEETKYFVDTVELRKKALELANNLSNAEERRIYKQMDVAEATIGKLIAETKTEEEKAGLVVSQRLLNEANARQIVEMLPYQQELAAAQTENQRAAAKLAAVQAAYQNKLLSSGYLDDMFRELSARADSAEAQAELVRIKAAIRNGTYGAEPTGNKVVDAVNSTASKVLAGLVNFMDNLNPISGMLGAAR